MDTTRWQNENDSPTTCACGTHGDSCRYPCTILYALVKVPMSTFACTSAVLLEGHNLVWTTFLPLGLWPKAELGSTYGIGVFYSVSRMER
jgi:hypothetical protein